MFSRRDSEDYRLLLQSGVHFGVRQHFGDMLTPYFIHDTNEYT
jgi:ribosomal protein S2